MITLEHENSWRSVKLWPGAELSKHVVLGNSQIPRDLHIKIKHKLKVNLVSVLSPDLDPTRTTSRFTTEFIGT